MFQNDLCNESVITVKCVDLLWVAAPRTLLFADKYTA